MPNTPRVEFNFKNNNVQTTTPLLGVSHVVARTTKGPFNQPDTVFTSFPAFQKVYGEEIVPDGTISNIKKAFENGSKLRISRVEGAEGLGYGRARVVDGGGVPSSTEGVFSIILADPVTAQSMYQLNFGIKTREAGSPVIDDSGYNLNRDFYLTIQRNSEGPNWKFYLTQSITNPINDTTLSKNLIVMASPYTSGATDNTTTPFIDAQAFVDFCNNVPNIEVVFNGISNIGGGGTESDPNIARVKTLADAQSFLINHNDWYGIFQVDGKVLSTNPTTWVINEGNNGGESNPETWVKAYEATKEYNDSYQLILSHVHQHLPQDYMQALSDVAKDVIAKFETVLYVEVPKEDSDGNPLDAKAVLAKLKTMVPAIGYAKNIAFFGGGLKYYDSMGSLQKSDVLGTVVGLGDTSASQYGPWYSFSGMNRGQVPDSPGPVMENVGAPAKFDKLQLLSDWFLNVFVIKDTITGVKRTMLWNGFTTHPKNDSFKFLSIVRLNLYLKKTLRPILENYLEEPNIWDTWKLIYYQAARVLDNLVDRRAISEYQWLGDQDVTSYDELQINNEADVRSGKYHVILKYKDIVPLQEITMDITIDAANQSITIEN